MVYNMVRDVWDWYVWCIIYSAVTFIQPSSLNSNGAKQHELFVVIQYSKTADMMT